MSHWSRLTSIAVQLADKRVLLCRKTLTDSHYVPWALTIERPIEEGKDALDMVNKLSWEKLGIDTANYDDSFVEIKRLSPIKIAPCMVINLFVVLLKTAFTFQAKRYEQFIAIPWSIALKDIKQNTAKYTKTTIKVAKELHKKGVFD